MANDGYNAPTRRVKVVFGKFFNRKKYIVKDVKYKFTDFKNDKGWTSRRAEVSISFALDMDDNRTISDIRNFT
jgi:hypothetical protein